MNDQVGLKSIVSSDFPQRNSSRVLVAEDDVALAQLLKKGLAKENFIVELVHDGETALKAAQLESYDLLILDLNLPQLDGLSVLRSLRALRSHLPVMVLTGMSSIEERVLALDSGADDYLSKPFSFFELAARARALLRRVRGTPGRTIQIGDLFMNRDEMRVEREGKRIALSAKEFAVLECLMANAGKPVTRSMIMESVWGEPYDASSNLVDVYVKYVRDKVDGNSSDKLIQTVRGVGYVVAQHLRPSTPLISSPTTEMQQLSGTT